MATYFVDIDGVIFKFGTMTFNEGAVEFLRKLKARGHQIVLSTARKSQNNDIPYLQLDLTISKLEEAKIAYDTIVGSLSNPRIIVNNQGVFSINHQKDAPISGDDYLNFSRRRPERPDSEKILNSFLAMAWTSRRHGGEEWEDADEYVQTILIARSLLQCEGFDHCDIVDKLATNPDSLLKHIKAGGLNCDQLKTDSRQGSIWKLINNYEKEYIANDGYLDGAAMRTLPVAAFYGDDLEKLVLFTNKISRITHAHLDARLAAILVSLRFRQLLFPVEQGTGALLHEMQLAIDILGSHTNSIFFMARCKAAAEISKNNPNTFKCLSTLIENIGMKHLAWSTPISAVFWSFSFDGQYERWLPPRAQRKKGINYATFNGELVVRGKNNKPFRLSKNIYSNKMNFEDSSHVKLLKNLKGDNILSVDQKGMDVDTFFSIAYSLLAILHGIEDIELMAKSAAAQIFEDDLKLLANKLSEAR